MAALCSTALWAQAGKNDSSERYRFEPLEWGARRLVCVDFPSRKEVVMELSAKWPRPWRIEEVAIIQDDALLDVWEASKRN